MSRSSQGHRLSPGRLRAGLLARLEARRPEIERAILTRAHAVSDPTEAGDAAYVEGLRAAISAGLSYGFSGIEARDARNVSIPAELFAQARHAARSGVTLDTVLRRYFAGYILLGDFLMQEAEDAGFLGSEEFQRLMRTHAARFDRILEAIATEFENETGKHPLSQQQRRSECVERLLAGELADSSELAYDLDACHVGAIAVGAGAEGALRSFVASLDRRLLLVRRDESTIWAWFGGAHSLSSDEVEWITAFDPPPRVSLSLGEPARGLDGWRFTHHQAAAALPIAQRNPGSVTRYDDVALLASILQDEVLTRSLHQLYLAPLADERDGGKTLRDTLRAYFEAERNVSSAASALRVTRKTVANRLHTIEVRLGRPINSCAGEIEAALYLEDLNVIPVRGLRNSR